MELPPAAAFRPPPTLTSVEVARRAAIELNLAKRAWRALGMPDVPDDEVMFTDEDVDALVALRSIIDMGFPPDEIITVGRVYGTALSRIADAETRLFRERLVEQIRRSPVATDEVVGRLAPVVEALLEMTGRLLDHGHRRHLSMALDALRRREGETPGEALAAGFVDLVDFSRISGDLPGEELGGMVDAFEDLAVEVCADTGVRLVKVIGDAVMFVSPEPRPALEAARTIVHGARHAERLPEARAGLDFGDVVALGGDYFGRPVNVAARITAFALPATVVVSHQFLDALGDDGVETSRIGTERLKGVGRVRLYKVRDGAGS